MGRKSKKDKIAEIVQSLDKNNDDHWTDDGLPAMAAIEEAYGSSTITREDVIDSVGDFKRHDVEKVDEEIVVEETAIEEDEEQVVVEEEPKAEEPKAEEPKAEEPKAEDGKPHTMTHWEYYNKFLKNVPIPKDAKIRKRRHKNKKEKKRVRGLVDGG